MPPLTAEFQNEKFAAYGLPDNSFVTLDLETCNSTAPPKNCSPPHFPLVLFSGALATSRLLYSGILQSVAAAGFAVVSLDHPYDADFVEFPDGTNITAVDLSTDADIELALTTRVQDVAFLYRQLSNASSATRLFPGYLSPQKKMPRTAMIGHSLGGATVAAAMLHLPDIRGGLNLDGSMFGPVLETGLNRPFMLLGHENKTRATDPSWKAIWPKLSEWRAEFEVKGAAHYSFSDLPLVTAALGLQALLPEGVGEVLGTVEGHRMQNITVAYITAFLEKVLKSGSDKGFKQASLEYPEVVKA